MKLIQTKIIDNQGKAYALIVINDSAFVLRSKTDIVGIEQTQSISEQIHIYPNPTQNKITIKSLKHFLSMIYIANALGQKVKNIQPAQSSQTDIDVSGLPNGICFLHIAIGEKIVIRKFVISR